MSNDDNENSRQRINDAAQQMVKEVAAASGPIFVRICKERQLADFEANVAIVHAQMQMAAMACATAYGLDYNSVGERLQEFIKDAVRNSPRLGRKD